MSFRSSKQDAALIAVEVAAECLARLPSNGWKWECQSAVPDPVNPDRRGRKVPRKWVVSILWSKDGTIFDGPGTMIVDVEQRTAVLVETP